MIDAVLAEANVSYDSIDRIGVCTGPGSFTGVRVGVAAARGLALGCGAVAVGVDRFNALALDRQGPFTLRLAGRGDLGFVRSFDRSGKAEGPPVVQSGSVPEEDPLPDPVAIARLARDADHPVPRPAPLYLRGPDAALPREGPTVPLD